MKPIYRFDPLSRHHWLEFDGKPEQATIDLLKANGWKWAGYRKQWHTNRRFAKVPAGIEYEDGGECDYASERPERLAAASGRAEARSEEAYERSNGYIEHIPMGQPIIRGTRGGRAHVKALERSRAAMDQSVAEEKKAEHLDYKAKSSASHQKRKERPDVIFRRIKRLKADIVSIRNSMKHEPWGLYTARERNDEVGIAVVMQAWAESNVRQEEKIRVIQAETDENQALLEEKGGLPAEKLNIEVGDIIAAWPGECKVEKINKRHGAIMSYTTRPLHGITDTYNPKRIIKIDEVGALLRKADGTVISERQVRTYTPPEPKEEREFAVEQVKVIDLYRNDIAYFPTPGYLAEEIVMELIGDAQLILEPSAGVGILAGAIRERYPHMTVHCCDIVPQFREALEARRFQVVGENCLDYKPDFLYDAIVMNPPFAVPDDSLAWVTHLEHVWTLLKPGGQLIAIVAAGLEFRKEKRIEHWRHMAEDHGYYRKLAESAFAESGTGANTCLLVIQKPEPVKVIITAPEPPALMLVPKEIPVFGDTEWIARARTGSRRRW